jgi:hypothetical protein
MEGYNYVLVDVEPGQKTRCTLNRFRPWSAEPASQPTQLGRRHRGGFTHAQIVQRPSRPSIAKH